VAALAPLVAEPATLTSSRTSRTGPLTHHVVLAYAAVRRLGTHSVLNNFGDVLWVPAFARTMWWLRSLR
jgi:hypothetical protein